MVRDMLIQRFGPDFAQSAIGNRDTYVSRRVSDNTWRFILCSQATTGGGSFVRNTSVCN
jgi:hypothetical protein